MSSSSGIGGLGEAHFGVAHRPPADRRRPSRNCPARRSAAGASRSPAPCARARRRSPGRRAGGTCPSRRRRRGPTSGTACPACSRSRTSSRGCAGAPASGRRARRAARAADDHAHGVIEVGAAHLVGDRDGLDVAGRRRGLGAGAGSLGRPRSSRSFSGRESVRDCRRTHQPRERNVSPKGIGHDQWGLAAFRDERRPRSGHGLAREATDSPSPSHNPGRSRRASNGPMAKRSCTGSSSKMPRLVRGSSAIGNQIVRVQITLEPEAFAKRRRAAEIAPARQRHAQTYRAPSIVASVALPPQAVSCSVSSSRCIRRARHDRGDEAVFVQRVGAVAVDAEAVEGRHAERRGEVAVRAAADAAAPRRARSRARRQARGRARRGARAVAALVGGPVHAAVDGHLHVRIVRREVEERGLVGLAVGRRGDTQIDGEAAMLRDDVDGACRRTIMPTVVVTPRP